MIALMVHSSFSPLSPGGKCPNGTTELKFDIAPHPGWEDTYLCNIKYPEHFACTDWGGECWFGEGILSGRPKKCCVDTSSLCRRRLWRTFSVEEPDSHGIEDRGYNAYRTPLTHGQPTWCTESTRTPGQSAPQCRSLSDRLRPGEILNCFISVRSGDDYSLNYFSVHQGHTRGICCIESDHKEPPTNTPPLPEKCPNGMKPTQKSACGASDDRFPTYDYSGVCCPVPVSVLLHRIINVANFNIYPKGYNKATHSGGQKCRKNRDCGIGYFCDTPTNSKNFSPYDIVLGSDRDDSDTPILFCYKIPDFERGSLLGYDIGLALCDNNNDCHHEAGDETNQVCWKPFGSESKLTEMKDNKYHLKRGFCAVAETDKCSSHSDKYWTYSTAEGESYTVICESENDCSNNRKLKERLFTGQSLECKVDSGLGAKTCCKKTDTGQTEIDRIAEEKAQRAAAIKAKTCPDGLYGDLKSGKPCESDSRFTKYKVGELCCAIPTPLSFLKVTLLEKTNGFPDGYDTTTHEGGKKCKVNSDCGADSFCGIAANAFEENNRDASDDGKTIKFCFKNPLFEKSKLIRRADSAIELLFCDDSRDCYYNDEANTRGAVCWKPFGNESNFNEVSEDDINVLTRKGICAKVNQCPGEQDFARSWLTSEDKLCEETIDNTVQTSFCKNGGKWSDGAKTLADTCTAIKNSVSWFKNQNPVNFKMCCFEKKYECPNGMLTHAPDPAEKCEGTNKFKSGDLCCSFPMSLSTYGTDLENKTTGVAVGFDRENVNGAKRCSGNRHCYDDQFCDVVVNDFFGKPSEINPDKSDHGNPLKFCMQKPTFPEGEVIRRPDNETGLQLCENHKDCYINEEEQRGIFCWKPLGNGKKFNELTPAGLQQKSGICVRVNQCSGEDSFKQAWLTSEDKMCEEDNGCAGGGKWSDSQGVPLDYKCTDIATPSLFNNQNNEQIKMCCYGIEKQRTCPNEMIADAPRIDKTCGQPNSPYKKYKAGKACCTQPMSLLTFKIDLDNKTDSLPIGYKENDPLSGKKCKYNRDCDDDAFCDVVVNEVFNQTTGIFTDRSNNGNPIRFCFKKPQFDKSETVRRPDNMYGMHLCVSHDDCNVNVKETNTIICWEPFGSESKLNEMTRTGVKPGRGICVRVNQCPGGKEFERAMLSKSGKMCGSSMEDCWVEEMSYLENECVEIQDNRPWFKNGKQMNAKMCCYKDVYNSCPSTSSPIIDKSKGMAFACESHDDCPDNEHWCADSKVCCKEPNGEAHFCPDMRTNLFREPKCTDYNEEAAESGTCPVHKGSSICREGYCCPKLVFQGPIPVSTPDGLYTTNENCDPAVTQPEYLRYCDPESLKIIVHGLQDINNDRLIKGREGFCALSSQCDENEICLKFGPELGECYKNPAKKHFETTVDPTYKWMLIISIISTFVFGLLAVLSYVKYRSRSFFDNKHSKSDSKKPEKSGSKSDH